MDMAANARQKIRQVAEDLGRVEREINDLVWSEEEARESARHAEADAAALEERVTTLEDLIVEFFLGVRDEEDLRQAVSSAR